MFHSEKLEKIRPDLVEHWRGQRPQEITAVHPPELSGKGSLVFASKQEQFDQALAKKASVIVAHNKISVPTDVPAGILIYKSSHVGLAMAAILPHFDSKKERFAPLGKIHPQSFVHPSSKIGANVTIGAFTFVGENAVIGDQAIIGSQVTIERNAKVGARTLLHPQSFIGADCELGEDCEIHPHVTIGSDGFGFAQDREGNHHKLPQLGRVIVGNRVEIGANCAIDRAAFTETRIGDGVKLDNLCHIAHNCTIGPNAAIAGGFFLAGSSKIGRSFMTGGSTVVADHVSITDGVVLAGRSTVTNDIATAGVYGGYPIQPVKDHLKTIASLPHLVSLRKQVARLVKHLGLTEEESK